MAWGGAWCVSAMTNFTACSSQGCLPVKGPPSAEVYVTICWQISVFQVAAAVLPFLLLLRLLYGVRSLHCYIQWWTDSTGLPNRLTRHIQTLPGPGSSDQGKMELGYIATTTIESIRSTCKLWRWENRKQ